MSSAVRLCFARNFALAASSLHRAYEALSVVGLASGVPTGGHWFGRVLGGSFEAGAVADAAATAFGRRGFWVPVGLLSLAFHAMELILKSRVLLLKSGVLLLKSRVLLPVLKFNHFLSCKYLEARSIMGTK